MSRRETTLTVYRGGEGDELASLRAENARLRRRLADIMEGLRPFSAPRSPCPFCDRVQYRDRVAVYEPPRRGTWFWRARPARLRRECNDCGAHWYERTKEAGDAEPE